MKLMLVATAGILSLVASAASAQQGPPQFPDMTFFVTSKGLGNGGNLGGLEGADKHCQALATAAGAGARTWHAYLSTQADGGKPAVNARDRIGKGPWKNAKGEVIATSVDDLHSPNNKLTIETDLTETGRKVSGFGFLTVQHDMLTGSTSDGRAQPAGKDLTCGNWTKNSEGAAMVGHSDRNGTAGDKTSWNASHPTPGCDTASLAKVGGAGLFYCFATN